MKKTLNERLDKIQKQFIVKKTKKISCFFPKSCVFCTTDQPNKDMSFGVTYPPDLIADEIVRKVYEIEKGRNFSRVFDSKKCKLHSDKWLTKKSHRASGFISSAIQYNDFVDVNPVNTKEILKLLSDFDTMDFIFHRNIERKKGESSFLYAPPFNQRKEKYYFEFACNSLRKVGKKWIQSLDPQKYDLGFKKYIDEYGPNFARGGVIHTHQSYIAKKQRFETWLEKAEKELGKGLIHNRNLIIS